VTYKLNLPVGSMIHPVFHVPQLKSYLDDNNDPCVTSPIISTKGKIRNEPVAVLNKKVIKRKNRTRTELLVKWSKIMMRPLRRIMRHYASNFR
jgi:hypothetical protein